MRRLAVVLTPLLVACLEMRALATISLDSFGSSLLLLRVHRAGTKTTLPMMMIMNKKTTTTTKTSI